MSKSLFCKLGVHKYRKLHESRWGFCGGTIIVICHKCGKSKTEYYYYFDTFMNASFGYAQLADLDNFEEYIRKQP
jgi:hypothetical protein